MNEPRNLPRKSMLAVAVVQGLLLFALYKAFDADVWPSQDPVWSFPLWTLAATLPLLFLLSIEHGNAGRVSAMLGGFAVVLALLAAYTGWQAQPVDEFPVTGLVVAFAFSIAVACFKTLMYLQQRACRLPLTYQVLFTFSWRNFLILLLSIVFVLVFWAILRLWASLFAVIEIDFFRKLFRQDWFLFPVLGLANGLGIIIFRELTNVIDNITALLRGLMKLLLPLVVAIAAIFLLALPFTGLSPLWATGSGTSLLLWLIATILFFTNAVYQDGRGQPPYPAPVHRFIYAGLFTLPFLCGLSFYGLFLRVDQYGWTVQRYWGAVVWLVLALFSAGYIWGIARRRAEWPVTLARVNTIMGLVVLALMLAANSPLLDFRKLALASQLARVDSGEIPLRRFDFHYAHHSLARPGYLALQDMKAELGDSDPELVAMIDNPQPIHRADRLQTLEEFWNGVIYRPEEFDLPPGLATLIERRVLNPGNDGTVLLRIDLDSDGQHEYVALPLDARFRQASYFWLGENGWQAGSLIYSRAGREPEALIDMLKQGDIELAEPRFKDLRIGDLLLKPR